MNMNKKIAIIGCGVQGLTTAWILSELGYKVELYSAQSPAVTTSSVAAAFFYPYGIGDFPKRWAAISNSYFRSHSLNPASGIVFRNSQEFYETANDRLPVDLWWAGLQGIEFEKIEDQFSLEFSGLGNIHFNGRYEFQTIVMDMGIYLKYLLNGVSSRGATIHFGRNFEDMDAVRELEADAIVNCTGIGSMNLVPDISVKARFGQIVRVAAPEIVRLTFLHRDSFKEDPVYIVPRLNDVVLGGSFEVHGDYNGELGLPLPNCKLTQLIIERCSAIEPSLSDCKVLDSRVGIRPVRASVRLEAESIGNKLLIHNYGHGGGGVTCSWGCALEVVRFLE